MSGLVQDRLLLWQVSIDCVLYLLVCTSYTNLLHLLLWRLSSLSWFLLNHLSVVRSTVSRSWIRPRLRVVLALAARTDCRLSSHSIVTQMSSICLRRVTTDLATRAVHAIAYRVWWTASRCESRFNFSLGCTVWGRSVWTKTIIQAFSLCWCILGIASFWLCRSCSRWLCLASSVRAHIATCHSGWCFRQTIWSFRFRLSFGFTNYRKSFKL